MDAALSRAWKTNGFDVGAVLQLPTTRFDEEVLANLMILHAQSNLQKLVVPLLRYQTLGQKTR